ncbi:MAG: RtcB family protein [Gammaproteobacteria bacterium]
MPVKQTLLSGLVPIKIFTDHVEPGALSQLVNLSQLPIVHGHIAVMPDVHEGIGATVGSVIPTKEAIIPAAVGVDIGCGMNAVQLSLSAQDLPDNLRFIRLAIEERVPVGFEQHKNREKSYDACRRFEKSLNEIFERHPDIFKMINKQYDRWICQMGTLGGGNHFIELCLDENDKLWVMLHSGSRGIGNAIGRYFIQLAKQDMERHLHQLPHRDLAYFKEGSKYFADYIEAVSWAQAYAFENRKQMMNMILSVLQKHLPPFLLTREAVNCHHNYVEKQNEFGKNIYLTRKGAISARVNELGIIPGSMGARSYIIRGKGSAESFHSCAHGAGRVMSRTEAKRRFKQSDVSVQTWGVECRKDSGIIDEIPAAYKNIDDVMAHQTDLVDVEHTLRQIICIKG